jgi:hypothetical protein
LVNDDYGDSSISKNFYDGVIQDEQIEIAEEVRKLIRKRIGPYTDFELALSHPEKVDEKVIKRYKNIASIALQLQWVANHLRRDNCHAR